MQTEGNPIEENPILKSEDYFKQYNEQINNLKNRPEVIELDKLCFELFEANEQGRKFLQLITERYLIPPLAMRSTATYQIDVIWGEGFKEAFRMLKAHVASHQQRIAAGK